MAARTIWKSSFFIWEVKCCSPAANRHCCDLWKEESSHWKCDWTDKIGLPRDLQGDGMTDSLGLSQDLTFVLKIGAVFNKMEELLPLDASEMWFTWGQSGWKGESDEPVGLRTLFWLSVNSSPQPGKLLSVPLLWSVFCFFFHCDRDELLGVLPCVLIIENLWKLDGENRKPSFSL